MNFNLDKATLLMALLAFAVAFVSCDEDDEAEKVKLLSFGPSPVLRGGELKFIGTNLDKVTSIVLPENVEVTEFASRTSTLITLTVPEAAVEGKVILKTSDGDIESVSSLGISEPITIKSFSPDTIKPGNVLTITGTYLNLIGEVIFPDDVVVTSFQSQSKTTLEVMVPAAAKTGIFGLSNGADDPIIVKSATQLNVVVSSITALAPSPVKPGNNLTITGTDFDLATKVLFPGGSSVGKAAFVSSSATSIVVAVPDNVLDGPVTLEMASEVQVKSANDLVVVAPTITGITPQPVKPGNDITVEGTDLDLVNSVLFGGEREGMIKSSSATELVVTVPANASESTVEFVTTAKSVTSATLPFVQPTIGALSHMERIEGFNITITGTDLDLVESVIFGGELSGTVVSSSETSIEVTVPAGSESGPVVLVTKGGAKISSAESLVVIPANIPLISEDSTQQYAKRGSIYTIRGEKMHYAAEVLIGGVTVTKFGQKQSGYVEVIVPAAVSLGTVDVVINTLEGFSVETEVYVQEYIEVQDEDLVFFDFDNTGNKDFWWNDVGVLENNAELSLDGTSYLRVDGGPFESGWRGLFWRNGGNNFPGSTVGTNASNYVLRFDINVMEPITGGTLTWRFKGETFDNFLDWAPWQELGSYKTDGWVTITIPLSSFSDVPDFGLVNSDFGAAYNNAVGFSLNIAIDNVRFETVD